MTPPNKVRESTTSDLTARIDGSIAAIESMRGLSEAIDVMCDAVSTILRQGGTIYTAGNGGSAAQAMHLAEEFIGRYRSNRPPCRAVCLNADPTALTCIANDFGFAQVFARQCEALLTENDCLVVLSTSGNSENIVNALRIARSRSALTIGLLGNDGGACRSLCDHAVIVPATDSAHIQEAHQVVIHLICEHVERSFAR